MRIEIERTQEDWRAYCALLVASARLNHAAEAVPESWLGRHVYELLPEGLHTSHSSGTGVFRWSTMREVRETPAHILVYLDNVTALVIPKRDLAPYGGADVVLAGIERLRNESVAREATVAEPETSAAQLQTPVAPADAGALVRSPGMLALPRNLLAGLRLATWLPVSASHFHSSPRQSGLLFVLALAVWALAERVFADGDVAFAWYALAQMAWLAAVAVLLVLLLTPRVPGSDNLARLFTAIASALPAMAVIVVLARQLPLGRPWNSLLALALAIYAGAILYRAQRVAMGELRHVALGRTGLCLVAMWFVFSTTVWAHPQPWYSSEGPEEERDEWAASEATLFAQPDLVDAAVERLAAGTAGKTEAYFVGFAGFGEQGVFDREIRFAMDALGRRVDLDGRSLTLINTPEERDEGVPLATISGLKRSLAGLAGKMNTEEDVLLLFLTSHGSEDAELSVSQGVLPLDQLDGETLRSALDEAGIRWRVVMISACHAGSFIPFLSDEHTLVITAARADKSSFGCSDERDLTYFGEAFLRDALPQSSDLQDAFTRARRLVGERERAEGLEPSDPQIYVGERMKVKLGELAWRTATSDAASGAPPQS